MKALLLVGGFGTRLRPLTFEVPKPLVEFANKPIVEHQIEALVNVGVKQIILGVGFQSDRMVAYCKELSTKLGVDIVVSQETEPMGTAGPLKLAEDKLTKDNPDGLFFVFNSDVICDFPLTKLIDFHKSHGGEGTILLTGVEDPSKYGVVLADEKGQIQSFVEKPQTFIGNRINAGIYLFHKNILNRIPLKPTSIEREIFPQIAAEKKLYSLDLEEFWMDIGQPRDFLTGLKLYLNYLKSKNSPLVASGPNIIGNVLIHPEAKVHPEAVIGPNVSIGRGCVVDSGARIQNSCLMSNSTVGSNSWLSGTIIETEKMVVVAEDVTKLSPEITKKFTELLQNIAVKEFLAKMPENIEDFEEIEKEDEKQNIEKTIAALLKKELNQGAHKWNIIIGNSFFVTLNNAKEWGTFKVGH